MNDAAKARLARDTITDGRGVAAVIDSIIWPRIGEPLSDDVAAGLERAFGVQAAQWREIHDAHGRRRERQKAALAELAAMGQDMEREADD